MQCASVGCKKYPDKIGVLLAQLGTPDSPDAPGLRKYLAQFLWDPRVIEKNRVVWWLILNGIILRTRPKRSARLYKRIWTAEGSPLLRITKNQTLGLNQKIQNLNLPIEVAFGMRYGNPSLESAIDGLIEKGCTKILTFPMYPQYAAATTASTCDAVFAHVLKRRWVPTLRVAEPYFNHPRYVEALAAGMNRAWKSYSQEPDFLVLSYHGIPEAYINKGDPYCCMCTETTRALLPLLSFPAKKVIHTYQSRFGKDPWLVPYTDVTIENLAKQGAKRIAVACPGFTADCLETLDEVGHEAAELFKEHGGESLELIPCLNDSEEWISALHDIVVEELGSWVQTARRQALLPCGLACPVQEAKAAQQ